jgi:hypothetical protein
MFADEIRRAIEAASRIALPRVTALLWRAYGEGTITEAEAERLSALIGARTDASVGRIGAQPESHQKLVSLDGPQDRQNSLRQSVGSRPRTDLSLERRRRWAASGRLPPGLAARFTLAEQAVLAFIAAETVRRKDCRLAIENLAAVAGVSRSTVKNAIREAKRLGLLTVEERVISGNRNDTNILRIVSPEWLAWLRLARQGDRSPNCRGQSGATQGQRGGVKSVTGTNTEVHILSESRKTPTSQSCRGAADDLDRAISTRIRQDGRKAGALR